MTDRYDIVWPAETMDQLAALTKRFPDAPAAIVPAVYELTDNPTPPGSTQLGGSGTYRRLLLGYYRVIYSLADNPRQIRIILVGRSDTPR